MRLCIQDPSWPNSVYLLEEILEGCEGALHGAGVFGFASTGGVKLLIQDPAFASFLSQSRFELVVGVDAITDIAALDALASCAAVTNNLNVRVFLDGSTNALFHGKMCWFRHPSRGICLVGSGNLTPGGLRGNCEAFTVTDLKRSEQVALEKTWYTWLKFHSTHLFPVDHRTVRDRARRNSGTELGAGSRKRSVIVEDSSGKISVGAAKTASTAVLIAEIPRSGNRWNQANFDISTFQNFFGATPGHTQRIILTHIGTDGQEGAEEVRPSVSVSSQNYRFELEAAAGLPYPSRGRPIAIFVRIATRTFRYRLLMPGTRNYAEASRYLKHHSLDIGIHVRRLVTNVKALTRTKFFDGLSGISRR
jgi:hypothetical protein